MAVVYTATVGTKSYGFDFEDQRIDVDATVDSLLVGDLWTAIKEAQASVEGMAYNQIASGSGLNTLGTGVETFLTVTLLDNWEVNTLKASGKFEVGGGNLIRADNADPFRDNPLITYIAFLSQAGIATQIETGVSGLTAAESLLLSAAASGSYTVEDGKSLVECMRLQNAALFGKASGAPNSTVFRDLADTKDRITSATDDSGNRTSVTLDET